MTSANLTLKIQFKMVSYSCLGCHTSGISALFSHRNQTAIAAVTKIACPYCGEWTAANEPPSGNQVEKSIQDMFHHLNQKRKGSRQ